MIFFFSSAGSKQQHLVAVKVEQLPLLYKGCKKELLNRSCKAVKASQKSLKREMALKL